jgi:hypothetical protein
VEAVNRFFILSPEPAGWPRLPDFSIPNDNKGRAVCERRAATIFTSDLIECAPLRARKAFGRAVRPRVAGRTKVEPGCYPK